VTNHFEISPTPPTGSSKLGGFLVLPCHSDGSSSSEFSLPLGSSLNLPTRLDREALTPFSQEVLVVFLNLSRIRSRGIGSDLDFLRLPFAYLHRPRTGTPFSKFPC